MSFAYVPPPFPFPEAWPQLFQTPQTKWLSPNITTLPFPLPPPPASPLVHSQGLYNGGTNVYGAPHLSAPFATFPTPESMAHRSAGLSYEDASDDSDSHVSSSDEGEDDGEYVYGYVLSDEWRGRFRNSLQARQRQQQQRRSQHRREQRAAAKEKQPAAEPKQSHTRKQNKRKQQQHFPSASDQRAMDLQRELAAAKQRETMQRRLSAPSEAPSTAAQDVRCLETQLSLRFDEFCDAFLPVVWPHDAIHK